jgi:hypothetical protein
MFQIHALQQHLKQHLLNFKDVVSFFAKGLVLNFVGTMQIHTISTWHATASSTETSAALACMFTLLDLAGQYKNKKAKNKPTSGKNCKRKKKRKVKAREIWAGGALLFELDFCPDHWGSPFGLKLHEISSYVI